MIDEMLDDALKSQPCARWHESVMQGAPVSICTDLLSRSALLLCEVVMERGDQGQ